MLGLFCCGFNSPDKRLVRSVKIEHLKTSFGTGGVATSTEYWSRCPSLGMNRHLGCREENGQDNDHEQA
jgi:hypothetical protein